MGIPHFKIHLAHGNLATWSPARLHRGRERRPPWAFTVLTKSNQDWSGPDGGVKNQWWLFWWACQSFQIDTWNLIFGNNFGLIYSIHEKKEGIASRPWRKLHDQVQNVASRAWWKLHEQVQSVASRTWWKLHEQVHSVASRAWWKLHEQVQGVTTKSRAPARSPKPTSTRQTAKTQQKKGTVSHPLAQMKHRDATKNKLKKHGVVRRPVS